MGLVTITRYNEYILNILKYLESRLEIPEAASKGQAGRSCGVQWIVRVVAVLAPTRALGWA